MESFRVLVLPVPVTRGRNSKREIECCSLTGFPLGPYPPSVPLDDPLHGGQAYAETFELFGAREALEGYEELARIRHIESFAIVPDKISLFAVYLRCTEFNDRLLLTAGPLSLGYMPHIPSGEAVARTEAPRGELIYYLRTNGSDRPERIKWRVPSYPNWEGLHCQDRSLFRPLDSPGDTGGPPPFDHVGTTSADSLVSQF